MNQHFYNLIGLPMPHSETIMVRDGTILRYGHLDDIKFIDSLRKKEAAALGFIPIQQYQAVLSNGIEARKAITIGTKSIQIGWRIHDVLITEDNGEQTGFFYVSFAPPLASMFQIVVRPDARRWHRALMMVDFVEEKARALHLLGIKGRVAIDLESNAFWQAIGFIPVREVTSTWLNQHESQSKRPLYVYEKRFDDSKPLVSALHSASDNEVSLYRGSRQS